MKFDEYRELEEFSKDIPIEEREFITLNVNI